MAYRWLTVPLAAAYFGVSTDTVWRWIRQTHEAQVPRQKIRLEDSRGRRTPQLIVEMNALSAYESTLSAVTRRESSLKGKPVQ